MPQDVDTKHHSAQQPSTARYLEGTQRGGANQPENRSSEHRDRARPLAVGRARFSTSPLRIPKEGGGCLAAAGSVSEQNLTHSRKHEKVLLASAGACSCQACTSRRPRPLQALVSPVHVGAEGRIFRDPPGQMRPGACPSGAPQRGSEGHYPILLISHGSLLYPQKGTTLWDFHTTEPREGGS